MTGQELINELLKQSPEDLALQVTTMEGDVLAVTPYYDCGDDSVLELVLASSDDE